MSQESFSTDDDEKLQLSALVRRAQQGDRHAQGQLYTHYYDRIFRLAVRKLGNTATAEDLTQDVFIHAFHRIGQLRCPAAFGGWLRQITIRMAINLMTRNRSAQPLEAEALASIPGEMLDPVEIVLRLERHEEVQSGIEQLGVTDRETLKAFYFEDHSINEMATRFEAPTGTIKRRLHTARKRLADRLLSPQAV
ncbi:MAG: hypothetical protein KatS3mg111_2807 [Pirellulaceae bacterium]|nr:MAG: hypothetical protein KatS3mg111_2807 [Pirellulaceae bacterium]